EGIVPGGGVAQLHAARALDELKLSDAEEQTGVNIVKRALEEPLRQLAHNAGADGSVGMGELRARHAKAEKNVGFNVVSEQYVDLVQAGIIDPAKVTRSALENGASVAGMILTTEAMVSDIPEEERKRRADMLSHRPPGMARSDRPW